MMTLNITTSIHHASWRDPKYYARLSCRSHYPQHCRGVYFGFRCAFVIWRLK